MPPKKKRSNKASQYELWLAAQRARKQALEEAELQQMLDPDELTEVQIRILARRRYSRSEGRGWK